MVGTFVRDTANFGYHSQATGQGIVINATVYNLTTKSSSENTAITYSDFPWLTTFLDYLPYMVFTNMFAIFYLETISMTKKTARKQDSDKKVGHYINFFITGFYLIIFGLLILLPLINYGFQKPNVKGLPEYGGIGAKNYTNMNDTLVLATIQPYAIFLKGWYSQQTIYISDLNNWNALDTTG